MRVTGLNRVMKKSSGPATARATLLGVLQGDGLGDDLAQDDVHVGDDGEGKDAGQGVGEERGVGQARQRYFEQAGHGLFADPAQGEAGHGDADLNAVEDLVELVVQLADGARADASLLDELLEAGVADADQGVLAGGKESVGGHQQDHGDDPHEDKGEQGADGSWKTAGSWYWILASGGGWTGQDQLPHPSQKMA